MIQVVNRALDILEYLSLNKDKEIGLAEIARDLKINPATCANILKTLMDRDYVHQTCKRGSYSLGDMVTRLEDGTAYNHLLKETSKYAIEDLRNITNETTILSVIKNDQRHLIYKAETSHEVIVKLRDDKPIYASGTARQLLAFLSPEKREDIIRNIGLPAENQWPGIDTKEKLTRELDRIKDEKTYFMEDPSHDFYGLCMPIHRQGQVIASLSVFLPFFRYNNSVDRIIRKQLRITGEIIEEDLE